MEEPKNEDILKVPLLLFKLSGLHPDTSKGVFLTLTIVISLFMLLVTSVGFLHIYLAVGDAFLFLESVGSCGIYVQAFAKAILGAIKRKELIALITKSKQFWDTSKTPAELKEVVTLIFSSITRLQKLFLYMVFIAFSLSVLYGYLSKQLPCGVWLIQGHDAYYVFHFVMQGCIMIYVGVSHVVALDEFFLTLCISLIAQFILLNHSIKEMSVPANATSKDECNFREKLLSNIKHHDFLLKFAKQLATTYSPMLLFEYVTLVTILCAAMLIVIESNNAEKVAFQTVLMSCCFMQLLFYCLLVDYMNEQALNVCNSLYSCGWYTENIPYTRNLMMFAMQRSQRGVSFSAGGLYEIKSATLLSISKMAWSICIAVRSVKPVYK